MPMYRVNVPFAGYIQVEVEADNEQAAENAALDAANELGEKEFWDALVEMDYHRQIVQGNVLYAPLNRIEIFGDDEE